MISDLTQTQREFARWIVDQVSNGLSETFYVVWPDRLISGGDIVTSSVISVHGEVVKHSVDRGTVEILGEENLLRVVPDTEFPRVRSDMFAAYSRGTGLRCTVTARLTRAVARNFVDEQASVNSALAHTDFVPPDIVLSLARLRNKFPDQSRLGFIIMRFAAAKPFENIVDVIKTTGTSHGLTLIRADENEFHSDLWGNVRTLLHGCGFGVAVYERIETDEPNANVGLEVGYLLAMNKPVLLLKDKTVATLQADLAGKLYKPFDPHDPTASIPPQMNKWLQDYGIAVTPV